MRATRCAPPAAFFSGSLGGFPSSCLFPLLLLWISCTLGTRNGSHAFLTTTTTTTTTTITTRAKHHRLAAASCGLSLPVVSSGGRRVVLPNHNQQHHFLVKDGPSRFWTISSSSYRKKRSPAAAHMVLYHSANTANNNDDDSASSSNTNNNNNNNDSLSLQLRVASYLNAATCLGQLGLFWWSLSSQSSFTAPFNFWSLLGPMSSPLLTAGVLSILATASTIPGRLSSATYKRLSLQLAWANSLGSVLTLPVVILMACRSSTKPDILISLLGLVSTLNLVPAYRAWYRGVVGSTGDGEGSPSSWLKDLRSGYADTTKSLWRCNNVKTFGYLAATMMIEWLRIQKFLEIVTIVMKSESNVGFMFVTRMIRYSRLVLLLGVVYTLKDAANRDRLEGTTFIQLNFLSSLVFGAMAVQKGIPTLASPPITLAAAFFAVFTAGNGILSQMKKKNKA